MKLAVKNRWLLLTLLIWAIIFCVPPLHYHLRVAAKGSPWIQSTILPVHYGDNYSFSTLKNPPLAIKVYQLQSYYQSFAFTTEKNALAPLDKLIRENSNLSWLIALRLRATAGSFQGNRQGGEFSDARSYAEIQKGKPSIERNNNKVNFTQQEMRDTLALCRSGEKLEPQNAYFTWMRVYFLMLNWQDTEAMKALSEAASKSYWNNHSAEYQQLYANAAEGVLRRPLTSFERSTVTAIIPPDWGVNARMREMARILGWQGVKLKRAGKNEAAVVLWANFYHVMTLALQGDSLSMDFLVNYAMASIATVGSDYPNPKGKKLSEEQRIQGFIAYANKYHRPDLARQIEKDWKANHELFTKLRAYSREHDYSYPSLTLAEIGAIFLQGTVLIILSIAGALLGWLLLGVYRFFRRDKSTFTNPLTNGRNKCKGIFACSGIPSTLLGILFLTSLIYLLNSLEYFELSSDWKLPGVFFNSSGDNYFRNIVDYLGNVSGLSFYPSHWRLILFATPLICGAAFAFFHCRGKMAQQTFRKKLGGNIYLALLFLAWGIIALTTEYDWPQIAITVICGLFLLISFLRMWWLTKENSELTFSIFRSSLSGWICAGSVLVLILLISQSMINNKLQPWANNQVRGEMHLLHQVQDSPP